MADNRKKYGYLRRTFTDENGKRHEVTGRTKKEVEQKLFDLKNELAFTGGTRLDSRTTVDQWFSVWMETYKEPFTSYRRCYNLTITYNKHIKPYIGHMKLAQVRPTQLQLLLNRNTGMSKTFYTTINCVLRGMFGRAWADRMINFDPASCLTIPEYSYRKNRALTKEERKLLLEKTTDNLAVVVRIMLWAGLRPGECCALQWNDIDFKKNEIHVYKNIERAGRRIKGPKTAAGVRDIPMQDALRDYLLQLRGDPFEYVVQPVKNGVAPLDPGTLSTRFIRFRDANGISEDLTLYCLRHTFCTDLQAAEIPINVAKDLMGHGDISVTADIYTHREMDVLHRNITKLNVENTVEKVK